ncbi:JAB domain-containing protein [Comamonas badia]|uniref:JAB domain-containing protein n=1 Tax=Comamonas badia TaxID=265291 RepID=UPI000422EF60|nr:JAB domain-containing protein [Comamonas badia]
MATAHLATPPQKRALPLPKHRAGDCMAVYGQPSDSAALHPRMQPHERATITKALRILGRYLRQPGAVLDGPAAMREFLRLQLAAEPIERFAVLYMDSQHRAIAFEFHASGTPTQTAVYPREIVSATLRHSASGVVLTHNHPSGSIEPSRADKALTQTIKSALALIDVRVLDHVIVAGDQTLSMAERGLV